MKKIKYYGVLAMRTPLLLFGVVGLAADWLAHKTIKLCDWLSYKLPKPNEYR